VIEKSKSCEIFQLDHTQKRGNMLLSSRKKTGEQQNQRAPQPDIDAVEGGHSPRKGEKTKREASAVREECAGCVLSERDNVGYRSSQREKLGRSPNSSKMYHTKQEHWVPKNDTQERGRITCRWGAEEEGGGAAADLIP